MSAPSVTYRFITGSLISEREHNQNNADLVAALTDGTKDLTVGSILTNNHGTFYGTTTSFGTSSANTITANGTVITDILPSSSSINIGSTSFPWRAIYLDNGATDGGAIYFGATTKFIKCTADGTELDFSGFSTYDMNSKKLQYFSGLSNSSLSISGNVTVSGRIYGSSYVFSGYGTNLSTGSPENFLATTSGGNPIAEGYVMRSSGSIYAAAVQLIVSSYSSSGTFNLYVYKNNALLFTIGSSAISAAGAYLFSSYNITRDTYTFSANDIVSVYTNHTGSYGAAGYAAIGVYYDL